MACVPGQDYGLLKLLTRQRIQLEAAKLYQGVHPLAGALPVLRRLIRAVTTSSAYSSARGPGRLPSSCGRRRYFWPASQRRMSSSPPRSCTCSCRRSCCIERSHSLWEPPSSQLFTPPQPNWRAGSSVSPSRALPGPLGGALVLGPGIALGLDGALLVACTIQQSGALVVRGVADDASSRFHRAAGQGKGVNL